MAVEAIVAIDRILAIKRMRATRGIVDYLASLRFSVGTHPVSLSQG